MAQTLRQAFSSPITFYPTFFFLIILKLRRGSAKVSGNLALLHVWSILAVHFYASFVIVRFFSL